MQESIVVASDPNSSTPPPIIHAIGGAIGSALSILLCYPLERIRVEMMKSAGSIPHQDDILVKSSFLFQPELKQTTGLVNRLVENAESGAAPTPAEISPLIFPTLASDVRHGENEIEHGDGGDDVEFAVKSIASSFEILSEASNSASLSSSRHTIFATASLQNTNNDGSPALSEASSSGGEQFFGRTTAIISNDGQLSEETTSNTLVREESSPNVEDYKSSPHGCATISMWSCLRHLYKKNDLYTGAVPVICTLAISNFIYFYAHEIFKKMLIHPSREPRAIRSRDFLPPDSATSNSTITTSCTTTILDHGAASAVRKVIATLTTTTTTTTTTNGDNARGENSMPNAILRSFLASSLAGVVNVLLTNPMWVANLRIMQGHDVVGDENIGTTQRLNRSLPFEILYILRHEGIAKLWSGTPTSLLLVCNPAINHFLYEHIRNYVMHARQITITPIRPLSLSPLEAFLIGAFAKTIATVVTYPLQLAQVLIRLQKARLVVQSSATSTVESESSQHSQRQEDCDNLHHYRGAWDCITSLYRKGGLSALFVGMNAKLIQTVLTAAFTFLTYEQILSLVRRSYRGRTRLLSK